VIPVTESIFERDDPAFVQRTDAWGSSSQSAIKAATARFARPPVGGSRQLTTQHFRHGSQPIAFVALPAFTQSGIRNIVMEGFANAIPGVISFDVLPSLREPCQLHSV